MKKFYILLPLLLIASCSGPSEPEAMDDYFLNNELKSKPQNSGAEIKGKEVEANQTNNPVANTPAQPAQYPNNPTYRAQPNQYLEPQVHGNYYYSDSPNNYNPYQSPAYYSPNYNPYSNEEPYNPNRHLPRPQRLVKPN